MYLDISSFQTFSAEKDKKKFKDAPGIRGPTKKGVRDENLSCRMAQKRSSIQRIGSMRLMEKGQILGFRHVFRTIEVEVCHAI